MGRVLLCMGKTADKPYYVECVCQNVYTVEELCFVLRENAYLLSEQILDKKLVEWLAKECDLPELSRRLLVTLRAGTTVAAFVTCLLQLVGYCSEDEIQAVNQLLTNNAGLSDRERQKIHADYLVQNGRYGMALAEYETLLEEVKEGEPLYYKILHNMGTACTGVFQFERAAEYFARARACLEACYGVQEGSPVGELEPSVRKELAEYRMDYLAALRFSMREADYVKQIATQGDYEDESLQLEKRLAQARGQWKASESGVLWRRLFTWKQEGKRKEYYEQAEEAIVELKENYRREMA